MEKIIIEAIDLLFMNKKIDSKEDLAKKINVDVDYINGILKNEKKVDFAFLDKLINIFDLNANFFFKKDCDILFNHNLLQNDNISKLKYASEVLNMKHQFALRKIEILENELEL